MDGELKKGRQKNTTFINYLPELACLLFLAGLYLYNSILIPRPTSYAGLFVQMADLLRQNAFVPPPFVPFYGPGGTPYVYPYLGFYLLAAAQTIGVGTFDYLRFVPPIFTMAALIAFYATVRLYSGNRYLAIMATLLTATSPVFFAYHAKSAGIVRAPALFFSLLALYLFSSALKLNKSKYFYALPGIFLGLTIMTHLTYALFAALSLLFIAVWHFRRDSLEILGSLSIVGFLAVLISSPWWLCVINRHGLQIFGLVTQTHGTLFFTTIITNPINFLKSLLFLLDFGNAFLMGAGILSATIFVGINRTFLPVWWVIIAIGVGESQRFSPLFAGWLTAELFWFSISTSNGAKLNRLRWWLSGILLLSFCMLPLLQSIQKEESSLTDSFLSMAAWVKQSTPPDSSYFYLNDDKSTAEWLPYFSQRTPTTAPWGSEWTGQYVRQQAIFEKLSGCMAIQSLFCVNELFHEYSLSPNYLILPLNYSALIESLSSSSNFEQVFQNPDYAIFIPSVE